MASTDPLAADPPAIVRAAARGELPEWARAGERRRAHIARVANLLDEWAARLDLPEMERTRWLAAGWLHDVLRDATEDELRKQLNGNFADFPAPLLHGPAAAQRLAGQADEALLEAIRYHTTGHPRLDRLGRALYLADFLEPGREFAAEWRAGLAARVPDDLDGVLVEVLGSRIQHIITARKPLRAETAAFWSAVVSGA